MATEKLTEYERRRLETIKRNEEMLVSLKIHTRLSELSAAFKRQRAEKSYKVSPEKKPKSEEPVVIRRSLRTRGLPPDAPGLGDEIIELRAKPSKPNSPPKPSPHVLGPFRMRDAYRGSGSDEALIKTISRRSQVNSSDESVNGQENDYKDQISSGLHDGSDWSYSNSTVRVLEDNLLGCSTGCESIRVKGSVDLGSLSLEPENIARVVPGRIMAVRIFPSTEMTIIAAGNKFGDVGFWDVESRNEDRDGIYLYHPHTAPVSGILVQPFSLSKIYTSSYDGLVRLMDVEKEVFDLIYSSNDAIFSLSQQPNDANSIYFSEGNGVVKMCDVRVGNTSASWNLHENRINSVDFNSANASIMATSSTEGTAGVWDLRKMHVDKPKALKMVCHRRSVQSAYFSPSGNCLATTSFDNNVALLSGANFEDISMIRHDNQTGRWISSFRAVWGWNDSYIYVGNMKRGVDVLCTTQKRIIFTLQSQHASAIPCRFDAHPHKIGMLAGATSGGQIYIWTAPS
ncbi:hypothetical protein Nepgr_022430 [Nepenthes gracilis]|uniref:WD repeat-containing protein 76 n=1 Tax=Nepenthes gracilis TaxID=150966 RepID=A0AAD3T0Q9_NEPGR|nr:hypothetical protein Nepgr_022430 [Nepenthes gracilis]